MKKISLLIIGSLILVLLTAGISYAAIVSLVVAPLPGSASVTALGDGFTRAAVDVPINMENQVYSWLRTISDPLGLKVEDNTDAHEKCWLIAFRPDPNNADRQFTYAIQAILVNVSPSDASSELLELSKGWKLPAFQTQGPGK